METIQLFTGGLLFFIIAVFALSNRKKANHSESEKLDAEIAVKEKLLLGLTQHIDDRTLDRSTSLTKIQIEVLDIYQDSNIRIPADIIEDLSFSRIYDYQDIIAYIENQRNYWKLENSKKPFKRSVTK